MGGEKESLARHLGDRGGKRIRVELSESAGSQRGESNKKGEGEGVSPTLRKKRKKNRRPELISQTPGRPQERTTWRASISLT